MTYNIARRRTGTHPEHAAASDDGSQNTTGVPVTLDLPPRPLSMDEMAEVVHSVGPTSVVTRENPLANERHTKRVCPAFVVGEQRSTFVALWSGGSWSLKRIGPVPLEKMSEIRDALGERVPDEIPCSFEVDTDE